MSELKVNKENVLKAYRDADKEGKILLENLYGKETFENKDVRNRIKSFEDAMSETGRPDVPDFSDVPEDMKAYFIAQYKILVIVEALNEGWIPDWDNSDEVKWKPLFSMSPSAFAFDASYFGSWNSDAGGGSRLCFRNRELSDYCGIEFLGFWRDIQ